MLSVAVVGTGLMGRGIAAVAAAAGCEVALYDAVPQTLRAAAAGLSGPLVRAGRDLADTVRHAGLVVEAVAENLRVKQDLFADLDALAPDTALLASNTSVLPVSRIAERASRPGRVVGTHWWNPPGLIPVVEVVRGRHTTDETMERAVAALAALGKTPVRVERDVPGFVGNRLQHALWREAIALVEDGICDAETVDLVVRNTIGLRLGAMGPIQNADYVGLDLTMAIHQAVLPSLSRQTTPAEVLRGLVAAGDLGAKTGRGFLIWREGARAEAARRLAEHVTRQLATGDPPSTASAEHSEE